MSSSAHSNTNISNQGIRNKLLFVNKAANNQLFDEKSTIHIVLQMSTEGRKYKHGYNGAVKQGDLTYFGDQGHLFLKGNAI